MPNVEWQKPQRYNDTTTLQEKIDVVFAFGIAPFVVFTFYSSRLNATGLAFIHFN